MELFNTTAYLISRTVTSILTGEFIFTTIATSAAYLSAYIWRLLVTYRLHPLPSTAIQSNSNASADSYVQSKEEIVLISGCASGLGLYTSTWLALRGYTVFAGIRKEADKHIILTHHNIGSTKHHVKIYPIIFDITNSDHRQNAVNTIQQYMSTHLESRFIGYINNAGVSYQGPLECMTAESITQQFNINVISPILLIQQLLPSLRQSTSPARTSRIIFITSVAAYITSPDVVVYSATKHAVNSIADGLRQELEQFNISVVKITPGSIQSNLRSKGIEYQTKSNENHNTSSSSDTAAHTAPAQTTNTHIHTTTNADTDSGVTASLPNGISVSVSPAFATSSSSSYQSSHMNNTNDDSRMIENNSSEFPIPHPPHLETEVYKRYQANHNKCQKSFDGMSSSAAHPHNVAIQVEKALREKNPFTDYYAGSEGKYVPIITKLPDRVVDWLTTMNWKVE